MNSPLKTTHGEQESTRRLPRSLGTCKLNAHRDPLHPCRKPGGAPYSARRLTRPRWACEGHNPSGKVWRRSENHDLRPTSDRPFTPLGTHRRGAARHVRAMACSERSRRFLGSSKRLLTPQMSSAVGRTRKLWPVRTTHHDLATKVTTC